MTPGYFARSVFGIWTEFWQQIVDSFPTSLKLAEQSLPYPSSLSGCETSVYRVGHHMLKVKVRQICDLLYLTW